MRMNYSTRSVVDLKRVRRLAEQLNVSFLFYFSMDCKLIIVTNFRLIILNVHHSLIEIWKKYLIWPLYMGSKTHLNVIIRAQLPKKMPSLQTHIILQYPKRQKRRLVHHLKPVFGVLSQWQKSFYSSNDLLVSNFSLVSFDKPFINKRSQYYCLNTDANKHYL